jgi:hypothetical protein
MLTWNAVMVIAAVWAAMHVFSGPSPRHWSWRKRHCFDHLASAAVLGGCLAAVVFLGVVGVCLNKRYRQQRVVAADPEASAAAGDSTPIIVRMSGPACRCDSAVGAVEGFSGQCACRKFGHADDPPHTLLTPAWTSDRSSPTEYVRGVQTAARQ